MDDLLSDALAGQTETPLDRIAGLAARARTDSVNRGSYYQQLPQYFIIYGMNAEPLTCRYCGRNDRWAFDGEFQEAEGFGAPICDGGDWNCDHTQDPEQDTEYVPLQVRHEIPHTEVIHFEPVEQGVIDDIE